MESRDELIHSHQTLRKVIEGISDVEAALGVVHKDWTIKDVLANIVVYEHLLGESFAFFVHEGEDKPIYTSYIRMGPEEFDRFQAFVHRDLVFGQILMDYHSAHDYMLSMLEKLSFATLKKPGTITWFKSDATLNDLLSHVSRRKLEMAEKIRLHLEHLRTARDHSKDKHKSH